MHEDEQNRDADRAEPPRGRDGRRGDGAEELLRQALLDERSAVSVSLRIEGLPVSESVTVIFYARRDLGTLQTFLTPGSRGKGSKIATGDLMRVPCDLDLAEAEDREEAEQLYAEQARALRDAVLSADVMLGVWLEPLAELARTTVEVEHSAALPVQPPMPRLLPTALVARDAQIVVTPVCSARTLAEGRPPLGIACIQQDLTHIYQLSEDPESCVADFMQRSANHAHTLAAKLAHQEASVERFLQLSDAA